MVPDQNHFEGYRSEWTIIMRTKLSVTGPTYPPLNLLHCNTVCVASLGKLNVINGDQNPVRAETAL